MAEILQSNQLAIENFESGVFLLVLRTCIALPPGAAAAEWRRLCAEGRAHVRRVWTRRLAEDRRHDASGHRPNDLQPPLQQLAVNDLVLALQPLDLRVLLCREAPCEGGLANWVLAEFLRFERL